MLFPPAKENPVCNSPLQRSVGVDVGMGDDLSDVGTTNSAR